MIAALKPIRINDDFVGMRIGMRTERFELLGKVDCGHISFIKQRRKWKAMEWFIGPVYSLFDRITIGLRAARSASSAFEDRGGPAYQKRPLHELALLSHSQKDRRLQKSWWLNRLQNVCVRGVGAGVGHGVGAAVVGTGVAVTEGVGVEVAEGAGVAVVGSGVVPAEPESDEDEAGAM